MKRYLLICFILIHLVPAARAQRDTVLEKLIDQATGLGERRSYDSALTTFDAIFRRIKDGDPRLPLFHNIVGQIHEERGQAKQAHESFRSALLTGRRWGHPSGERRFAYQYLLALHRKIGLEDQQFPYAPPAEMEVADVWFPVISIEKAGEDSLDVIIAAGKYDGVGDSLGKAELFTHITPRDTLYHKDLDFYGTARVREVTNNHTLVRVKKHATIPLLKGDFTIIKASVPMAWRKLWIRNFLINGLNLVGNAKEPLYGYRYFYYYADSLAEEEMYDAMKQSVNEIVEMLAEDTLTHPVYGAKNKSGIFQGMNIIHAMHESRPEHLRLFLNFVRRFPAKYLGNDYRFSETYATWILNNTPFDPEDIKPFLLKLPAEQLPSVAAKLAGQIAEDNLVDAWLDEGMQQVNLDLISEAGVTARLMRDVSLAAQPGAEGWSDYLFAQVEKGMNRPARADSFLAAAARKFRDVSNAEGLDWIRNTRTQWDRGDEVRVSVQEGHLLSYVIAQSKNPRYFATAGVDHLVKIWDRTLGKEILTLKAHSDQVNAIDYSPNGRYFASVGDDSLICIWNAYNYSLMYRYKSPARERSLKFSPDNRFVVTGGEDSLIRFWDIQTGRVEKTLALHKGAVNALVFHPVYPQVLFSAGSDSMVYRWNVDDREMTRWYKHKGRALTVQLSGNGAYMSVVSNDSLVQVWDMESHRKLFWGRIFTHSTESLRFFASETFTPDSKCLAYPFSRDSFVVIRIKDLYERVYGVGINGHRLMDLQFTRDGQMMFARYDQGGPLRIFNFVGWDIQSTPNISWRDIHPYGNLITSVQFADDDNSLVVLHSEISKLDLRNGNNERLYWGYSLIDNPHLLVAGGRYGTYIDNQEPTVYFHDYRKAENARSFSLPAGQQLAAWEYDEGVGYVFLASKSGMVGGWREGEEQPFFRVQADSTAIRSLRYDQWKNRLYLLTDANRLLALDALTGEMLFKTDGINGSHLACVPGFVYVTGEDGYLYKISTDGGGISRKMKMNDGGPLYQVAVNAGAGILAFISNRELFIYNLTADTLVQRKADHEFANTMVAISRDGKRIATTGFDSKVNLYDAATGELLVNIHIPMNKGVLISDSEGHYLASRHTLDAIQFSYNNSAFSFDQFDVRLNRPDLILEKIGRADSALLKAFHQAYKKRLSRMNLEEDDIGSVMQLPVVRLRDRFAVQAATTQKEYEITVECTDSRYPLQSLQVLVNNTPLLGLGGRRLDSLNTQATVQKVRIPLSQGLNRIKVFCTNAKGVTSLRESFEIVSKYTPEKAPRTYFIGIGTAEYRDSRMNLQYSAKDIRDLVTTFDGLYFDLSVDTLIDRNATRENILALKKKLRQTTVNDRVILAVTGHGLLSDSLDFYYATWDIDFNRPERRGVRYEELEDLLNDIPARQKLMLIDACHSGALDKEELLALRSDSTTVTVPDSAVAGVKGIAPRGFGVRKKEKMEANSSFEMMQQLFTDLSEGNGAVIISAAGGMEYAFESGEWNNGVFTYCVRKGIEEKAADRAGNFDGRVSVQELLKYVSVKVSELTQGKQKPTSRRENIEYEWMLRF